MPEEEVSEPPTNTEDPDDRNDDNNEELGDENEDDPSKSRDLQKYTAQAISLKVGLHF